MYTAPMTTDMGFFVPHFFLSVDMGVPRIIGADALAVYDVLRRHVCRDDRASRGRLGDLYRTGHLVCSLSQAEIADFLAYSDRSIRRHVACLKDHGWIELYGLISHHSSVPIYRLGGLVSTKRGEGLTESFFADEWLQRAKRALTKHTRKVLKDPDASYRDLSTRDRVAFVSEWAAAQIAKAPRTVGEDAKPCDDETRGDDDPTVRGEEHSARE